MKKAILIVMMLVAGLAASTSWAHVKDHGKLESPFNPMSYEQGVVQ